MKHILATANRAVQDAVSRRTDDYYPEYHLAPPAGWMNDPNGLIFFQGRYHAFYQHHPYDANWGPMHWGHATSPDMVHWTHQPIALAPGDEADRDGCFSGSAVDDDGVLSLIYTGHVWLEGEGNDSVIREVQCLATSTDGIHFAKQGAVLLPPAGIMHFRDPKVWWQDNQWWMVVGARDANDRGQVLLYRGSSLRNWIFDRTLAQTTQASVYMWECPDFFPLNGEFVLLYSPQGMQQRLGYACRNLFQSGYQRGKWRAGDEFQLTHQFAELDSGHDFYAPQSFIAADGRRIVLAWMDMWQSPMPSQAGGWAGCMTLPRELRIDEQGQMRMTPVAELSALRLASTHIAATRLENSTLWLADEVTALELKLQWDLAGSTAERYGIRLGAAVTLWVDSQSQRLMVERRHSDAALCGYRSVSLAGETQLSLHIYFDRSSVEVFVNQGASCLSSRIYPQPTERTLTLFAESGTALCLGGEQWRLQADE